MMLLFGFFLFSISEHSFILKAAKKLFIARTRDQNLFKKDDRQNIDIKSLSSKARHELELHRPIKFHYRDNVLLYLSNHLPSCCFPSKLWPKQKRFTKLYNMTKQKLQGELNVIKVIKNLRNQKILAQNSVMTKEVKNQMKHQKQNLLNLEDTSDFDSNASTEQDVSIHLEDIELLDITAPH